MLPDILINGLVQAALLALICVGYSLAYGTARVVNFAHADVMVAGGGYLVLLGIGGGVGGGWERGGMSGLFGVAAAVAARTYVGLASSAAVGTAVAGWVWLTAGRLPFPVAVAAAVPCSAALAAAVFRVGYLRLIQADRPRTTVLLASLGCSIALQSILLVMWGSQRQVFPPDRLPPMFVTRVPPDGTARWEAAVRYGVIRLAPGWQAPVLDITIVTTLSAVVGGMALFARRSRLADAVTATADARRAAEACGIQVWATLTTAFLVGGAVAALGGTCLVLRTKALDPTAGFTPGILAFVACVMGGIGSVRGSMGGALVVGLLIAIAPAVPTDRWAANTLPAEWIAALPSLKLGDWSYGAVYLLMIIFMLFRPRGLFAQ
jgi:branched-chain amino acid transport system permease protein